MVRDRTVVPIAGPYRAAMETGAALDVMDRMAGDHLARDVVAALKSADELRRLADA